jgi:hypothetical protein
MSAPPASESCLSFSVFRCVTGRAYWRGRGWAKSQTYDHEKTLPSRNHSILSGLCPQCPISARSLVHLVLFKIKRNSAASRSQTVVFVLLIQSYNKNNATFYLFFFSKEKKTELIEIVFFIVSALFDI